VHDPHAAAAAAAGGLDDDRVADGARGADDLARILRQCAVGARHGRDAGLHHGALGRDLVAHQAYGFGARPDEHEAAALDPLGEVGVLGQEAVTRMDGLGIRHFGGADDGRYVEVAVLGGGRAYADRFIGQLDVLGVGIHLRMDHHRAYADLATGPLDAQGDFAPVCYEDLSEHGG